MMIDNNITNNIDMDNEFHLELIYDKQLNNMYDLELDQYDLEDRLAEILERGFNSEEFDSMIDDDNYITSVTVVHTTNTDDYICTDVTVQLEEEVDVEVVEEFIQNNLYAIMPESDEVETWEQRYENAPKQINVEDAILKLSENKVEGV